MKKILSLVLALVLVLGMIPAVFALEDGKSSNEKYQEAIDFLATVGLWKGGVPADEDVTRWQMALFVARFITGQLDDEYWAYTDEDKDSGFTDIGKLEDYQIGAVTFAAQKGIVVGIGENKFAPNDNVQYRDAITMIVRALGYTMKASQYLWGYISKATELNIIGSKAPIVIEDVAYTDAIAREVVAALLYNALFADVDGKTVAETTFGLGTDVVMITASEEAYYNANGAKVPKTGYVEYASLDEEGEPVGQKFYNPIKEFGFASKREATENIGNLFYITYLDNKHQILEAKSLAKVYMNFGDEAQEVTNLFGNPSKIKVAGGTYKLVNSYTYLNYNQGTRTVDDEIKFYTDNGSTPFANAEYYVGSDHNIYHVANPNTPIYIYSAVTDKYYAQKLNYVNTTMQTGLTQTTGTGALSYLSYEEVPAATINAILASNLGAAMAMGFTRQPANVLNKISTNYATPTYYAYNYRYISAYTKATVNGLDWENVPNRVTVRNYQFAMVTAVTKNLTRYQNGNTGGTEGGKTYITIKYNGDGIPYNNTLDAFLTTDPSTMKVGTSSTSGFAGPNILTGWADKITYTGVVTKADDLYAGLGLICYFNQFTRELEVVKTVEPQQGYVRSFSVADNSILIGDKTWKFGYDNLWRSPLGTADQDGTSVQQRQHVQTKNLAIINQFINQNVKYYAVDGKIVYIDYNSSRNDFIIIDSIVDFTTTGIKVMAYTTVTDSLEEITIEKFNGWNVGGSFDIYIYSIVKQINPAANINIPVETGVIYQVVSADTATKYYNITDVAGPVLSNVQVGTTYLTRTPAFNVSVNAYHYIVGLNGNNLNGFGATNTKATTANDYWLILVPATAATATTAATPARVYSVKGHINAVSFTGGTATFYKASENDYVLITTNPADLAAINASIENNVSYAVYDRNSQGLGNYNAYTGYTLNHTFTDLLTGTVLNVAYKENATQSFYYTTSPYSTPWYQPVVTLGSAASLIDGQIYKIVDGKLLQENITPVTLATAVQFYLTSGNYVNASGNNTAPTIVNFTYGQNMTIYTQSKAMNSTENLLKAFGMYYGHYKYKGSMDNTNVYYKTGVAKLRLYNGVYDGVTGAGYTDTPSLISLNTTSDLNYRYVYDPVTGLTSQVNYFNNGQNYTAYVILNKNAEEVVVFIDITGAQSTTGTATSVTVTGVTTTAPTATMTKTFNGTTGAITGATITFDCATVDGGYFDDAVGNVTATIDGVAATASVTGGNAAGQKIVVSGSVSTSPSQVVVTITRSSGTVTITANF